MPTCVTALACKVQCISDATCLISGKATTASSEATCSSCSRIPAFELHACSQHLVCGVDGVTYASQCLAVCQVIAIQHAGACYSSSGVHFLVSAVQLDTSLVLWQAAVCSQCEWLCFRCKTVTYGDCPSMFAAALCRTTYSAGCPSSNLSENCSNSAVGASGRGAYTAGDLAKFPGFTLAGRLPTGKSTQGLSTCRCALPPGSGTRSARHLIQVPASVGNATAVGALRLTIELGVHTCRHSACCQIIRIDRAQNQYVRACTDAEQHEPEQPTQAQNNQRSQAAVNLSRAVLETRFPVQVR